MEGKHLTKERLKLIEENYTTIDLQKFIRNMDEVGNGNSEYIPSEEEMKEVIKKSKITK